MKNENTTRVPGKPTTQEIAAFLRRDHLGCWLLAAAPYLILLAVLVLSIALGLLGEGGSSFHYHGGGAWDH